MKKDIPILYYFLGGFFYLLFIIFSYKNFIDFRFENEDTTIISTFIGLSFIGIWRYSNAIIHLLRGIRYRINFHFERKNINKNSSKFKHVFVCSFSYEMNEKYFRNSFSSVLEATKHFGDNSSIIISVSNKKEGIKRDISIVKRIINSYNTKNPIYTIAQVGKKRGGIVQCLDLVARIATEKKLRPKDYAIVLMDGDSILYEGTILDSIPFLKENIGAITVNNKAVVDTSSNIVTSIFNLRFQRRFLLMCSVCNVLTGRFSAFRGDVFFEYSNNEVILKEGTRNILVDDYINHFLHDGVRLTQGDDKSTIYDLFRNGYDVRFIPDVCITCQEDLPKNKFGFPNIWCFNLIPFMARYSRNSQNSNLRLVDLGIQRLGFARWWMNLDQKFSIFTPLVAPVGISYLAGNYGIEIVWMYIFFVLVTRFLQTLVICIFSGVTWNPYYPFLIYYDQVVGALVKMQVLFFPYGFWTRQENKKNHSFEYNLKSYLALILTLTLYIFFILNFLI